MTVEADVAAHYGRAGLELSILDALAKAGKDIDNLSASDLSGADEFHLGWRPATVELARDLGLRNDQRVLDIGSGIGGPARYFAETFGCTVTGIDLTQDYVDVAAALTRRCGLGDKITFKQASALALPFDDGAFDVATMIHVGMNIQNKAGVFAEARRVLREGGQFAVYDIMKTTDAELPYPMPWADTVATSFVETIDTYRDLMQAAGFEIANQQDRSALALQLGREMREKAITDGAPPLGLHLLMGPATQQRLANVMGALQQGLIAPVAIVARAV